MTKELFEMYCKKCNVYRTKRHIIAQRIGIVHGIVQNEKFGNFTLSADYRFHRTPELDAMYDALPDGRIRKAGGFARTKEP